MGKKDYYKILGVAKTSSEAEIRQAYKHLALKYHPDMNPDNKEGESLFKEITEAYSILSDPEKRSQYDKQGYDSRGFGFEPGFIDINKIYEDIFGDFFKGRKSERKSEDSNQLRYNIEIGFLESFAGTDYELVIPKNQVCEKCKGGGGASGTLKVDCPDCKGLGTLKFSQGFFNKVEKCPRCKGERQIVTLKCPACKDTGRVIKRTPVHIHIPKGVVDGERIIVPEAGEVAEDGDAPGDLIIIVKIREDKFFKRVGNEVEIEIPISFTQAILGDSLEIPTVLGKTKLKINPGTQNGDRYRLRGKGAYYDNGTKRGDQLVRIRIELPRHLTPKQKELLKAFQKASDDDIYPLKKAFFKKFK